MTGGPVKRRTPATHADRAHAPDRSAGDTAQDAPRIIDASLLAELERAFVHAPAAFAVTEGPTHVLRYANGPFQRLQSSGEIVIARASPSRDEGAAELAPLLDRVFRRVELVTDEVFGVAARWSCTAWPIASGSDVPVGLVVEVRDSPYAEGIRIHQRVIAERLLLGALRDRDIAAEARATGERAAFLASLGRDLAMSLDQDTTRNVVRRARLTREGTWCIVDLLEPNGMIHRLAVVHPDPAKQYLASSLADRWYESRPEGPIHLAQLGRPIGGPPVVITKDTRDELAAVARGPNELATIQELGFGALLVVPMVVQSRVLGAITFVTAEGDVPLEPEDIVLASDLADRCAMALDHARLYHETDALRAAADEASRAKSNFIRRMTHDLRTPLSAISGFVDLLILGTHGPLTEEQRTDLDRIKHNQRHLAALISQVITYVQGEGGRVEYHSGTVVVQQMLTDVAGMLDETAKEGGITVDLRPGDARTSVWADPDRMRQILMNVLSNAVKFTPRGGEIRLDFGVSADSVAIHVSDTGPGIPSDKSEEIFQPFAQLDAGRAHRQGMGLGLAISRDLARVMHGDLTVESTEGVGSRFTLTLPRVPHEAAR